MRHAKPTWGLLWTTSQDFSYSFVTQANRLSVAPLEPLATPVSRFLPPAARCKALQSPSTRTAVASPPGELTRARPMHTGTPPSMLAAHVSAPSILKVTTSRPLPTQDGWSYRPDQGLSTASTACTPLTACALHRPHCAY